MNLFVKYLNLLNSFLLNSKWNEMEHSYFSSDTTSAWDSKFSTSCRRCCCCSSNISEKECQFSSVQFSFIHLTSLTLLYFISVQFTLQLINNALRCAMLQWVVKLYLKNIQLDLDLHSFGEIKYNNFQDLKDEQWEAASADWHAIDDKFPQKLAAVSDVVDHIDHIVKVAGINHVGIGTDFDGGGGVTGCTDVSEMGNITLELVKRGYTKKDIKKIWGGNLMRVMKEVDAGRMN